MKSCFSTILMVLSLTGAMSNASSSNLCTNNDSKASATKRMDMRNWLVFKSEGKSLTARIIVQSKDHDGFVIGHCKPIKIVNGSLINVLSYHPVKQKLSKSKILVASNDAYELGKLLELTMYICQSLSVIKITSLLMLRLKWIKTWVCGLDKM